MPAYDKFSTVYDKLMYDCDYDKWSQYLLSKLHGKGIDFACGSGSMTIAMKKGGLDVFGVDISRQMLERAKEKAKKEHISVEFLEKDMTNFSYGLKLDFVTCLIDGVNYLTPKKTERFFENVYKMLKDGGTFIFDVSSKYKIADVLANNFFYDDEEDVTYLWTNKRSADGEKVTCDLCFFVKDGEKYTRFDERHVLFVKDTEDMISLLKKVGFRNIKVTDDNFKQKPKEKAMRIVFEVTK